MFPRETITADSLLLRPPTADDAADIARASNDPQTARFIPAVAAPYTLSDADDYLAMTAERWAGGGAEFVVTGTDGGYLGQVGLRPPDARGHVEIGYVVAPWARGKGVATAAARAVTEWAFEHG